MPSSSTKPDLSKVSDQDKKLMTDAGNDSNSKRGAHKTSSIVDSYSGGTSSNRSSKSELPHTPTKAELTGKDY